MTGDEKAVLSGLSRRCSRDVRLLVIKSLSLRSTELNGRKEGASGRLDHPVMNLLFYATGILWPFLLILACFAFKRLAERSNTS